MCGDLSAGTDLLIYKHKVDHGHFKGRLMLVGGNDVKDGIRSFEISVLKPIRAKLGRSQ